MFDLRDSVVYKKCKIIFHSMRLIWITILFVIVTGAAFGLQGTGDVSQKDLPGDDKDEALNTASFEKGLAEIQWPSLDENSASVRSTLSEQLVAEIDASPLPVLIPADHPSSTDIKVRHSSHSLTVKSVSPERSFVLYGTRAQHSVPELKGIPGKSSERPSVMVSGDEGVWTATWTEYGVAYMLRLGCSDSDEECERLIRGTTNSLTFVGGRP